MCVEGLACCLREEANKIQTKKPSARLVGITSNLQASRSQKDLLEHGKDSLGI